MTPLFAHGVGTRADLPLPVAYVVVGGGLAVVVSFLALGALWRTPRLRGDLAGRPVPPVVEAFCDGGRPRAVLQALTLALVVLVVVVAFAGSPEIPANVAPWAFFVTFWVGLVPASLLLGPVWGVVNPLRAVHRARRRLTGRLRGRALPAPRHEGLVDRWGYWPAAVSLAAFAWFELAAPERSDPRRVGVFVVGYAVVHLAAATFCGERWFTRGDGFEVYSRLLGRLAPSGAGATAGSCASPLDRAWRSPRGSAGRGRRPVGSTAFDGGRTRGGRTGLGRRPPDRGIEPRLASNVGLVGLLYGAGSWLSGRLGGNGDAAGGYAHTLLPIAAGYAIAHYFSLLAFDGQTTWILLSDPFAGGANLLGLTGRGVDYTVVSARTIALVQVAAIVGGHVLGVVLAHDRAVALAAEAPGRGHPVRSQVPLLVIMVTLTTGGLGLLLGG